MKNSPYSSSCGQIVEYLGKVPKGMLPYKHDLVLTDARYSYEAQNPFSA